MSTKPPADPTMERGANPVRPATAPTPRKPTAPPPKSGFQRFVLQFLLLVIALGGAFGTGYLVNANETQLERNDLLQEQLDAQERILALEKQVAELQERRESGNRVELDLTEVFEPIREAVGRIALVRMGEISREITTELTRLVEDDIPTRDEPANATGTVSPGGMNGGSAATDRTPPSEAASAVGETAPGPGGGPDPPQQDSAAVDAAEPPDQQPEAIELVGAAPDRTAPPAATAAPAVSRSAPASEPPGAGVRLPATSEQAALLEAREPPPAGSRAENTGESSQRQPSSVTERTQAPPGSPGGVPTVEGP